MRPSFSILATYFDKYPDLKSMFREYDALAVKIENILIRSLSFGNMLSDIAIREEMAAMKSELILPGADVIDKVLASNVIVSHLGHLLATAVAAMNTDSPALASVRDRRLTSAQKRLLVALDAYDRIAKAKAKGLRPKGDLKIFEPEPVAE